MPFVAKVNMPKRLSGPPARGYVYDSPSAPIKDVRSAVRYLDSELDNHPRTLGKADFLIPFVWEYEDKKFFEVFGFFDFIGCWPKSNPEVYSWVFMNGRHMPKRRSICCGEALQILGKEMEYRSATETFEEYVIGKENPIKTKYKARIGSTGEGDVFLDSSEPLAAAQDEHL